MALAPLRIPLIRSILRVTNFTPIAQRSKSYKSFLALDNIYPESSLKITSPEFVPDKNEKFSGYIPMSKLDISYCASSGPGGQNVNKVHTKVDVRFKLDDADWLHPDIRAKIKQLHGNKITKEGCLMMRSDTTRSQQLNLADCLRKLRALIRDASVPDKQPDPETKEMIRKRQLKAARLRLAVKRETALKRAMGRVDLRYDL